MLLLTRAQALGVRNRSSSGSTLLPRPTNDGRYAVSDATLTDAAHTAVASTLSAATSGTATLLDVDDRIYVDGKEMRISTARESWAITEPSAGVFRHEIRANSYGSGTDSPNKTRRSEIIAAGSGYAFSSGETVWASWSSISGDHPGTDNASTTLGLIHQWHSVDTTVARGPVIGVDISAGTLTIITRSDAELTGSDGTKKVRYSTTVPAKGVVTNFVLQATLGQSGHLTAWINGSQVYDAAIPIGYYNDDAGARALAYPHWGIYTANLNTTDVMYHANIEWGTTDLTARIASPLSVPDLSPWA